MKFDKEWRGVGKFYMRKKVIIVNFLESPNVHFIVSKVPNKETVDLRFSVLNPFNERLTVIQFYKFNFNDKNEIYYYREVQRDNDE